jgi:hypothetical protein
MLVFSFQIGFMSQRNIHENIVIEKKMIHNMHKMKGKNSFFAIKVDLSNAYELWQAQEFFFWQILLEIRILEGLLNKIESITLKQQLASKRREIIHKNLFTCINYFA